MDDAQKVKEAVDIVTYIGRFIQLKKSGRNFLGLCPFHGESTPSFNVSPERGIFKCFGCGKSGDVITFVMEREGLPFNEALKLLANEAGITLSTKEHKEYDKENRLYEILDYTAKLYHHLLLNHPQAEEARQYLNKRGFDIAGEGKAVVEEFKIGFAPNNWRTAHDLLLRKGFTVNEMREAGVLSEKNGRVYDMFRNRVMFPLVNRVGRIVGFSGRVLDDSKPKYINTAETPIFHKREFLFGFYNARESIRKTDTIIIVEGEMDMLSSYRIGVKNVSAVKGSALTPEHIKNIKHLTTNIKLCFDADNAGDMAQVKAIHDAINAGCSVEIITLPEGKDADECIRTQPKVWKEVVKNTKPFYDFLIETHVRRHGLSDPRSKSAIIQSLKPFITTLEDPVIKAHYVTKLAHTVSIEADEIQKILRSDEIEERMDKKYHVKNNMDTTHGGKYTITTDTSHAQRGEDHQYGETEPAQDMQVKKPVKTTPEHYLIALLIRSPKSVTQTLQILPEHALHDTSLRLLYNAIAQYTSVREVQPIEEHLAHIVQEPKEESLLDVLYSIQVPEEEELLLREIRVSSLHIARQWLHKALDQIAKELKKADSLGDTELKNRMNILLMKLIKHKGELEAFAKSM